MVLDGVVGPPRQQLGDLGPLVAHVDVAFQDGPVLGGRPGLLANVRVEVVVPPLPALLADPAGKLVGDDGPLLGPVPLHELDYPAVLLRGPRALDEGGLEDLVPAVEAFDLLALGEAGGDGLPVLGPEFIDGLAEGVVLLLGIIGKILREGGGEGEVEGAARADICGEKDHVSRVSLDTDR